MKRPWPPLVFLLIGILGGVAIAFGYSNDQSHWASSVTAEVWAPTYQTAPLAAGLVTAWQTPAPGSRVAAGTVLGQLAGVTGQSALRAMHAGTLVGDFGYQGALVQPGQELALVADLSRPYVLAYVDESYAGKLAKGQTADVIFASNPGKVVEGKVGRIYPAVAEMIWPLPALTAGQNFSKSAQWVPVRIDFPQGSAVPRILGMTASVRIAIKGGGS